MTYKQCYRIQLGVTALLAALGLFVSDKILRSTTCPPILSPVHDFGCEQHLNFLLAVNAGFFLKSLIVVAFILMLFPERAFKWWRGFALLAVPFSLWWINWTAGQNVLGGGFFTTTGISDIVGYVFSGITLVIVLSALIVEYVKKSSVRKSGKGEAT